MKSIPIACAALLAGSLLSAPVHADPRFRHHRPERERPEYAYTRIVVRNHPYFYHRGYYYRRGPRGYILVEPPLGAVVAELPFGAIRLRFGGVFYRYYGGIYYAPRPAGYVVVSRPDTVYVDKGSDPEEAHEVFVEPKSVTVMVKNSNGSKTPVRLEEMEDGKYKGPKGEIYDSLPGQDQLRPVYGF